MQQRGERRKLEIAKGVLPPSRFNSSEAVSNNAVFNHPFVDPDALVEADDMRRGIGAGLISCALQKGFEALNT